MATTIDVNISTAASGEADAITSLLPEEYTSSDEDDRSSKQSSVTSIDQSGSDTVNSKHSDCDDDCDDDDDDDDDDGKQNNSIFVKPTIDTSMTATYAVRIHKTPSVISNCSDSSSNSDYFIRNNSHNSLYNTSSNNSNTNSNSQQNNKNNKDTNNKSKLISSPIRKMLKLGRSKVKVRGKNKDKDSKSFKKHYKTIQESVEETAVSPTYLPNSLRVSTSDNSLSSLNSPSNDHDHDNDQKKINKIVPKTAKTVDTTMEKLLAPLNRDSLNSLNSEEDNISNSSNHQNSDDDNNDEDDDNDNNNHNDNDNDDSNDDDDDNDNDDDISNNMDDYDQDHKASGNKSLSQSPLPTQSRSPPKSSSSPRCDDSYDSFQSTLEEEDDNDVDLNIRKSLNMLLEEEKKEEMALTNIKNDNNKHSNTKDNKINDDSNAETEETSFQNMAEKIVVNEEVTKSDTNDVPDLSSSPTTTATTAAEKASPKISPKVISILRQRSSSPSSSLQMQQSDPPLPYPIKRSVSFSDENGGELSSLKEIVVSPSKLIRRVRRFPSKSNSNNDDNKSGFSSSGIIGNTTSKSSSASSTTWGFSSFFGRSKRNNTTHQQQSKQQQEEDDTRLLILLMDPPSKQYELTSILYQKNSQIPGFEDKPIQLRELIPLISSAASHEPLKKQNYIGFTRPSTGVEMLNTLTVADYSMKKDEVLIAIPDGYTAKECSKFAKPILEDSRLVHLLKKLRKAQKKRDKLKSRVDIYKTKEMKKIDERKVISGHGMLLKVISGGAILVVLFLIIFSYKMKLDHQRQQQEQMMKAKPCFGNVMCRMRNFDKKKKKKEDSSKVDEEGKGGNMLLARILEDTTFRFSSLGKKTKRSKISSGSNS